MSNFINDTLNSALKHAKRIIIIVVGFTVLLLGVIMIVLPGPAILIIPLGLAILAGEFMWAKKLLVKVKKGVDRIKDSTIGK